MSFVKNPIKRIYIDGDRYPHVKIEVELPTEVSKNQFDEKIKTLTFKSDEYFDKENANEVFDIIMKLFGITIKKSDMTEVTFVNMFCSDKDAKLSDMPEPIPKQKGTGVLL